VERCLCQRPDHVKKRRVHLLNPAEERPPRFDIERARNKKSVTVVEQQPTPFIRRRYGQIEFWIDFLRKIGWRKEGG
jgi:hypothetical protein